MHKNHKVFAGCLWLLEAVIISSMNASIVADSQSASDTLRMNRNLTLISQMKEADSAQMRIQLHDVLNKSKGIHYLSGIAQSASRLGAYYHQQFNLEKAREYFSESLEAFHSLHNKHMEASMANNLGTIAEKLGNYGDAVSKYLYAFDLFDSLKNTTGISATANNLGIVYYLLDNPRKALGFFRVALSIKKQLHDTTSVIYAYQNMGNVHFDLWQYDSATYYYRKCIDLSITGNDVLSAGKAYNSLGVIAMIDNDQKQALSCFNQALFYSQQKQDMQNISSVYDNLGLFHQKREKPGIAIAYFDSSLMISRLHGLKEEMKIAYLHLSDGYARLKNYKEAYNNLQGYESLQSELMAEKGNVAGIETLFIKQKQEYKILLLEKEQEQRKAQLWMLTGILIVLIVTAVSLFYIYWLRQKARLERQYAEQEKARFKAVIEAQEMERKRIAGDLHDSVGQMLSLSKLHLSEIAESIPPDSTEQLGTLNNSMRIIDEACQEVRNISHNLMPGALIRLGLVAAIKDLARKINSSKKVKVVFNNEFGEDRLNENVEISIFRIIQELMGNCIKHARAGEIVVSLLKKPENLLQLIVADNGVGFNTDIIRHSNGIGWKNIYSRLGIINGKMNVTSGRRTGTTVDIEISLQA